MYGAEAHGKGSGKKRGGAKTGASGPMESREPSRRPNKRSADPQLGIECFSGDRDRVTKESSVNDKSDPFEDSCILQLGMTLPAWAALQVRRETTPGRRVLNRKARGQDSRMEQISANA